MYWKMYKLYCKIFFMISKVIGNSWGKIPCCWLSSDPDCWKILPTRMEASHWKAIYRFIISSLLFYPESLNVYLITVCFTVLAGGPPSQLRVPPQYLQRFLECWIFELGFWIDALFLWWRYVREPVKKKCGKFHTWGGG